MAGAGEPARLARVRIRGFRSARDVTFEPGPLCALVGEASAGKSNLLAAVRMLLDPDAPAPVESDVNEGSVEILVEAELGARQLALVARPPAPPEARRDGAPPVLFLPAELRAGPLVDDAPGAGRRARALDLIRGALDQAERSAAAPALSLVAAIESCCTLGIRGLVLLIEEPELYLRPQAQRYLYRLLRAFAAGGNQVLYSTHSPAFLNVARLEELVFVVREAARGTRVHRPEPLAADDEFRAVSEFDAERSELFLARAALLVEGATEKAVFPFVFERLGEDPDRRGISIVECGGKSNIPFIGRICRATGVPFVAVHDRDSSNTAERALNALIAEVAGADRTVVLDPDLERIAGLRGRHRKPERAQQAFAERSFAVPEPLLHAARLATALAREEPR